MSHVHGSEHPNALARRRQIEELVRLSRSTIYAGVKAGTFPAPIRIGRRAVAWRLSDVEQWLAERPATTSEVLKGAE